MTMNVDICARRHRQIPPDEKETGNHMLRKTVLVRALSLAFATAALGAAVMNPAMAQSNASGNIIGTIDQPAGATVNLLNTGTGLKRTITPEANGRYQATALPAGHYKVDLVRGGSVVNTVEV